MRTSFVLALACVVLAGCKVEKLPSREQVQQQNQAKDQAGLTPQVVPSPNIDDAQLVLSACGQPASDQVLAIYNKMNNGPVRRMVYRGRRVLTLDFVPSIPQARAVKGPMRAAPPTPPAGSVWRFDEARMEKEELMTSARVGVYLPCAGAALAKEY
jgi:hypothetical protein